MNNCGKRKTEKEKDGVAGNVEQLWKQSVVRLVCLIVISPDNYSVPWSHLNCRRKWQLIYTTKWKNTSHARKH